MCDLIDRSNLLKNERINRMFRFLDRIDDNTYISEQGIIEIKKGKLFLTLEVAGEIMITFYDQPTSLKLLDFAKIVVEKCTNPEVVQVIGDTLSLNGGPIVLLYDLNDNDIELFYQLLDSFDPKYVEILKRFN